MQHFTCCKAVSSRFVLWVLFSLKRKWHLVLLFSKSNSCYAQIFPGNIMSYSYGFSNFWTASNLLELKSENSTFPMEQLSQDESATVVAIVNLGGLMGNFIIIPLSQIIGIKRVLHSLGLVMIVSSNWIFQAHLIWILDICIEKLTTW